MSGHSKWATTKRAKAAVDQKRGAAFTKISNIITIAAREKGGDPASNFTLRMAVDKARAANMPKDNIEKAIKRGTGELEGGQIDELYYEGIGPAASQFIVKSLTDNKNRSAGSVRHAFSEHGGQMGAVGWNFHKKGVIRVSSDEFKFSSEDQELEIIDMGAEDIKKEAEGMTIFTAVSDLQKVKDYFDRKNVKVESAEIEYVAKDTVDVSDEDREKIEKFIMELEDNEDVSDYYTNVNL